ncbi:MAG: alanine--tRNA ligase [Ignavibacteria bacterium CG_4_10_14_3_um_filter_37_18]|nr:MAG: alanine--tRNA ligase [Ignavibacteria bacterium CG_4_10_14_3_um_filter_37_18]
MTSQQIRKQFLDFFESKQHKIVNSAPVVPFDDPTLLFTNAGMNQFKDVFLGTGTRQYNRAADTQKCIRVSGKHNDLEEVGHDTYHHTFFEMLGNWSFGDYYKTEAITWAWELLTEVWKMPKERLFATVYRTDDESFELWKTKTDINPAHILRFDEKDNFWEMGETGPCGPCSEIHINLTDDYDNSKYVNAGTPECIEIWNLVFIQYNRDENGKLHDLPSKHVDTGMGFERVCAVMQKKGSNYDTDVFMPLINRISEISDVAYEKEENKIPMRVIADHIRTLTFAIADGAVPGNDGRGYVLRRILRRASRYGRKLNMKEPFLFSLVDVLVETMSDVFPEIKEKQEYVKKIIKSEEESFNRTLDRGIELFETVINDLKAKNGTIIRGEDAFKLYDTFGFPVDLTNVMAREIGFSVDENSFNELMNKQKERGREATKDKFASVNVNFNDLSLFNLSDEAKTEFTGYEEFSSSAKIIGLKKEDKNDFIILDKSPFYVESGGQTGDTGLITINKDVLYVSDVTKVENKIIHVVENDIEVSLIIGSEILASVDETRRGDIMRNHSVTHFLHAAMRKILGTHVHQAGSLVAPDKLRFDFSHFAKVSEEELRDIEILVNEQLRRNIPLTHHRNIPFDEAKKMGALMFFGDKYGDKVNVVQFGDFSMEFCGGTHVKNSSQIGLFKILSESSIASGVRRIEAVTGAGVEKFILEREARIQKSEVRINELIEEKKKLEKELAELKLKGKLGGIDSIVSNPTDAGRIKIFKGKVAATNMDELKSFGDELRSKIKSGIGLLASELEGKVGLVCVVSDDLLKEKKFSAGKIVGEVAKILGGAGGGRPHLATAGGKDVTKIDEALKQVDEIVRGL